MRVAVAALFSAGAMFAAALAEAAGATPSGRPVPRFETLKYGEVNGRTGPSLEHPIAWRYRRAGLPVEVIAETAQWRKVRDPDGDVVWMHRRTLSSARRAIVRGAGPTSLRRAPESAAAVVALLETGVVLEIDVCAGGWCRVAQGRRSGWTPAAALWGVYPDEAQGSAPR